jgi:hypothetical protein
MTDLHDNDVFGTAEPSASAKDRPLVTFALFAYNQEAYIREAVEGAFAQTYSPLEIILSDDCSTDRTFEIMQEMAAEYRGPHRVRVRCNSQNLGFIEHCNTVWESVSSDIIVLAAGDDVSLPSRVGVSVARLMQDPGAVLVHSATTAIDHAGRVVGPYEPPDRENDTHPIRVAAVASIYIGATGAFKTSFYRQFGRIAQRDTYEDLILGFRAALVQGMRYIDQPLIHYRVGVGLSYQHLNTKVGRTQRRIKAIRRHLGTLRQRYADLAVADHPDRQAISKLLDEQILRTLARLHLYVDKGALVRSLVSRSPYWPLRAIFAEAKFLLRIID